MLLISTILNYGTHEFTRMNDLPYILMLPSYTATAFYHKKLAADLQQELKKTLREAEAFAQGILLAVNDRALARRLGADRAAVIRTARRGSSVQ